MPNVLHTYVVVLFGATDDHCGVLRGLPGAAADVGAAPAVHGRKNLIAGEEENETLNHKSQA